MIGIVQTIVTDTFQQQVRDPLRDDRDADNAMVVSFSAPIDYDRESGYRYVDLMLYAPSNYVAVLVRRRWNVVSLDDLEWDDEHQEDVLKPGADYVEGAEDWSLISYHDSGWRDGVGRFFREYEPDLNSIKTLRGWYRLTHIAPEEGTELLENTDRA